MLWDNVREEEPSSTAKEYGLWQDVLDFWGFMAQAPEYQGIEKSDFAEKVYIQIRRSDKEQYPEDVRAKALKKVRFSGQIPAKGIQSLVAVGRG